MPSAIEVHLVQVFFPGFLKFIQNVMKILELSFLVENYQKYIKSTKIIPGISKLWLVQAEARNPEKVKCPQEKEKEEEERGREKKIEEKKILAFPATRKAKNLHFYCQSVYLSQHL